MTFSPDACPFARITCRGRCCVTMLVTVVALSSAGCPKKTSPTIVKPLDPNPVSKIEADARERVRKLELLSQALTTSSNRLPGRNDQDHLQRVHEVFADLLQILPALEGPNPSGAFRQQQQITEGAQSQLDRKSGLAPEPAMDTGLRAAYQSLAGLARESYFDQPRITEILERLKTEVDQLDTVRGPGHQWIVSQVARSMSEAVGTMVGVLSGRVQDEAQAAPKPSAAPEPSTAPAE